MTLPTDVLVRYEVDRAVATLTLDSPANRNALSGALIDQLLAGLATAEADAEVRAVVLNHTGPVFCSGADLKETAALLAPGAEASSGTMPVARLGDVLTAIWESAKPVLARVAGPARAGGLGLIAAADIAVCAADATFAFSEVRIGVVPAVISATVLPRLHPRAAAELLLTGETFDGVRAERVGLVSAAVPGPELDATLARYLTALRLAAPGALAGTKALLRAGAGRPPREVLPELSARSVEYFRSAEGIEGMLAFRDKRPPSWAR
jgi:methylglutaconyl-CoA hydratase